MNLACTKNKIKMRIRQGCVFSPDLLTLYSKVILRDLEVLPGFTISGHNLNNIRYADNIVLLSKKKLQIILDTIIKKSEKEKLTINCQKIEYMVISKVDSQTHVL